MGKREVSPEELRRVFEAIGGESCFCEDVPFDIGGNGLRISAWLFRRAAEILRERHPRLRIAGRCDGYFKDSAEVVHQINASGAHMLFAALGSPRQERWLSENLDAISTPFCMGVGGSLDVLTGNIKRAPQFFQKTGTEFLYRLLCEPKRWRRQSVLPGFAVRVLDEAVKKRGLKALISSQRIDAVYQWT